MMATMTKTAEFVNIIRGICQSEGCSGTERHREWSKPCAFPPLRGDPVDWKFVVRLIEILWRSEAVDLLWLMG